MAAEPQTIKLPISYITVASEIVAQIGDGRIIEAFPELDEINALREQYREKVLAVLTRMNLVNKELSKINYEAAQMNQEITGKAVDYIPLSPIALYALAVDW